MHGLASEEGHDPLRDGGAAVATAAPDAGTGDGDFEIVVGEAIEETPDVLERNADDIAFVLSGFAGRKPRLGARLPDLEVRVAAALLDVGQVIRADRVVVLGLDAAGRAADPLPGSVAAALRPALAREIARVVGASVALPLGDVLVEELSGPLAEIIGGQADARLAETVWERVTFGCMQDGGLPEGFAELAWKALHHALRFQIGFTLAGMPSHRDAAGAFTDLFVRGNFPLGFMADGTFLVLAA